MSLYTDILPLLIPMLLCWVCLFYYMKLMRKQPELYDVTNNDIFNWMVLLALPYANIVFLVCMLDDIFKNCIITNHGKDLATMLHKRSD